MECYRILDITIIIIVIIENVYFNIIYKQHLYF